MMKIKKRKNLFLILLMLNLILTEIPTQIVYADTENDETSEQEIEYENVKINSVEDLTKFAENCHTDSWSVNKNVTLMSDLDISELDNFTIPVFCGIFDGNNHKISGFTINDSEYIAGFFRYLEASASVKNLTIEGNVEGTGDEETIGGLCGINSGEIYNCSYIGIVSGKTQTGMIAAVNNKTGYIRKCNSKGKVIGYYYTGGICGKNFGTISLCTNRANVNDDGEWVEEDDELGASILSDISGNTLDVKLESGVDTGGIAGLSEGIIIQCKNTGNVGYEHTGYNIGGIVGRQSGMVSGCTNDGKVLGKKDVGGIVGQLEPYIEIDETESVKSELDKLHDLINTTINDMQGASNTISADIDVLQAYGDATIDASKTAGDEIKDYVNSNTDALNDASHRVDTVLDMMPNIFDQAGYIGSYTTELENIVKQANTDLSYIEEHNSGEVTEAMNRINANTKVLSETSKEITDTAADMEDIYNASTTKTMTELLSDTDFTDDINDLINESSSALSTTSSILTDLAKIAKIYNENLNYASGNIKTDINNGVTTTDKINTALQSINATCTSIINYLNAQSEIQIEKISDEMSNTFDYINTQLKGISSTIKDLNQHSSSYTTKINNDLKAVNDQVEVVLDLILDKIDNISKGNETIYEDISDDYTVEEIEETNTGKVDTSVNNGAVEGNKNIGGIAGCMGIDEEDPEDSTAGNIEKSLAYRYKSKCLISGSKNYGYITAKKDGAGAITGYMCTGLITNCKGFGFATSKEGDYVGGIAGEANGIIKNCFAKTVLSGDMNVGGIAGYATGIQNCYSFVNIEKANGRSGAIAGQIQEEDEEESGVLGNYYYSDELYGVDGISYIGRAEGLSYEELLEAENLPKEFRTMEIIFKLDDSVVGTQYLDYDSSVTAIEYPSGLEEENTYITWQTPKETTIRHNIIVYGESHEYLSVVESKNSNAEDEDSKALALLDGNFEGNTSLIANEISIDRPEFIEEDADYVVYEVFIKSSQSLPDTATIRLLNPYNDLKLYYLDGDNFIEKKVVTRGSYIQTDFQTPKTTYLLVEEKPDIKLYIIIGSSVAGTVLLLIIVKKLIKKIRRKTKKKFSGAK